MHLYALGKNSAVVSKEVKQLTSLGGQIIASLSKSHSISYVNLSKGDIHHRHKIRYVVFEQKGQAENNDECLAGLMIMLCIQ